MLYSRLPKVTTVLALIAPATFLSQPMTSFALTKSVLSCRHDLLPWSPYCVIYPPMILVLFSPFFFPHATGFFDHLHIGLLLLSLLLILSS
jgi:hypothetical protein